MITQTEKLEDAAVYFAKGEGFTYREAILRRWVNEGLSFLAETHGRAKAKRIFRGYLAEVKLRHLDSPSVAAKKTVEALKRSLTYREGTSGRNEQYAASLVPVVEVAETLHPFLSETVLRLAGNTSLRREVMQKEVGRAHMYQRACNGVAHIAGANTGKTRNWTVVKYMVQETAFGVILKRVIQYAVRAKVLLDLAIDSMTHDFVSEAAVVEVWEEASRAREKANRFRAALQKHARRLWEKDLPRAEAFAEAEKVNSAFEKAERDALPYWERRTQEVEVEMTVKQKGKRGRGKRVTAKIPNPVLSKSSRRGSEVTFGIGGQVTEEKLIDLLGGQARYEEVCRQTT